LLPDNSHSAGNEPAEKPAFSSQNSTLHPFQEVRSAS
jgi:hypothetical protein